MGIVAVRIKIVTETVHKWVGLGFLHISLERQNNQAVANQLSANSCNSAT